MRATLQRALDRIEKLNAVNAAQADALTQANIIIARDAEEKKALNEVIEFKNRTITAKDEALAAERDANAAHVRKDKVQNERIDSLEGKLKAANKRNKVAFITGVVVGFTLRSLLGF